MAWFLQRLLRRLNPARRPRTNLRVVKRKYVKWHLKRAHHTRWPQPDARPDYIIQPL